MQTLMPPNLPDTIEKEINAPLARHTSWRVGGNAEILLFPKNQLELQSIFNTYKGKDFLFLGLGSNTLIRDAGIDGVVINTKNSLTKLTLKEDFLVYAEAGVACAKLARFCARENMTGAE